MKALRIILMITLPLLVVGGGGFAAFKMIEARPEPEKKTPEIVRPLVRVIEAQPSAVRLTVKAEGVVTPRTESQLVPEVSGRVLEVSPSLIAGGFFEAGEVVLRIDAREYELAVIQAQAAVAQSKLRVATEEQEAEVARKEWAELGEGEPTPLVMREPQLAEAKAGLASAEAALDQAEFNLERTIVKAPYTSRVRQKSVDVGQYVQRGQAVATIYAVDVAEVRLPIPDEQLAYVDLPLAYRDVNDGKSQPGPPVTLRTEFAGKEYSWQGRIVRTEGEIDARTRMVHAIAQVQDPYAQAGKSGRPPLAVGMFVEAEIAGRTVRAVELPRTAMRDEDTVMVVSADNRIEFRDVQVLRAERDRVLINGGLSAGERICVSTLEAAVAGMEVRVLEDSEAASAAD
ncbi:MAG: efflux RND transporter periplasmic adaptor subunit [Acidobacteria bacterium]|nr:efflux RND transporter periplasmic adaptor subunit [Acidobacteriota bacterium]